MTAHTRREVFRVGWLTGRARKRKSKIFCQWAAAERFALKLQEFGLPGVVVTQGTVTWEGEVSL